MSMLAWLKCFILSLIIWIRPVSTPHHADGNCESQVVEWSLQGSQGQVLWYPPIAIKRSLSNIVNLKLFLILCLPGVKGHSVHCTVDVYAWLCTACHQWRSCWNISITLFHEAATCSTTCGVWSSMMLRLRNVSVTLKPSCGLLEV